MFEQAMITLPEMAGFNSLYGSYFISGLFDLKNQLVLVSFFSSFLMHHIATHFVFKKCLWHNKLIKAKAGPSPINI